MGYSSHSSVVVTYVESRASLIILLLLLERKAFVICYAIFIFLFILEEMYCIK